MPFWPPIDAVRLVLGVVHVSLAIPLALLGTAIVFRPKTTLARHPRFGTVYVVLLSIVLPTGSLIGLTHPGISPFEIATPPTLLSGWIGWCAATRPGRRRLGRSWRSWHVQGMAGSFIGVVTATGFQTLGRVVPQTPLVVVLLFATPTVVGSFFIGRVVRRLRPTGAAVQHPASLPGVDRSSRPLVRSSR